MVKPSNSSVKDLCLSNKAYNVVISTLHSLVFKQIPALQTIPRYLQHVAEIMT